MAGALILVAAVALAGALAWIARDRALKLIYPARSYPVETPDNYDMAGWEDVRFSTVDGLTLAGWFVPPAPDSGGATIIYVHGFAGNRGEMLPQAALMTTQGYGALLIDLRNCGDSEGTQTTLGFREPLDVAAAVEYLQTRPEVDADRIALVGVSLGAAASIRAAAVTPQVRGVVAESAFSSLQDNVEEGVRRLVGLPPFPFAPLVVFLAARALGQNMNAVRPVDDVGRIAPRALLLIHGSDDHLIDVGNSRRLFAAAGAPKDLWIVPGGHHSDLMDVAPEEFHARLTGFLAQHLHDTP